MKNEELRIKNYGGQVADSRAKIVSKKENSSSFFVHSSSFLSRVSVALWRGARGLIGLKINIKF